MFTAFAIFFQGPEAPEELADITDAKLKQLKASVAKLQAMKVELDGLVLEATAPEIIMHIPKMWLDQSDTLKTSIDTQTRSISAMVDAKKATKSDLSSANLRTIQQDIKSYKDKMQNAIRDAKP